MKLLYILSGRSPDTHPMILLNCDEQYYLINAVDCSERIFYDSHISIPRLKYIFLTSCQASSIAGLFGLTIAYEASETYQTQKKHLGIMGPESLLDIYENSLYCRAFQVQKPILKKEYEDKQLYVKLYPLVNSVIYKVKLADELGRFLPEKAKKLGVKPGPDFKRINNGEEVHLPNGNIVTLMDCVSENITGDTILVIDCKSEKDVEKLFELEQNDLNSDLENNVSVVIHMTKPEIMNSEKYLKLAICNLPPERKVTHISFFGSHNNKLLLQSNEQYEKFVLESKGFLSHLAVFSDYKPPDSNINFINMDNMDSFILAPNRKRGLIKSKENKNIIKVETQSNTPIPLQKKNSFSVSFLGTGARKLTLMRNTAGILLHTEYGFLVLDAGEGFTGQLYRKFGEQQGNFIIQNIIAIWISHQHIDHFFGLHQLLERRKELCSKIIPLICDVDIIRDIKSLERNSFKLNLNDENLDSLFNIVYHDFDQDTNRTIKLQDGKIKIKSVDVVHMPHSKGALIELNNLYKIAYSGDRSLEDNFPNIVGNVDFLIHEATFTQKFADKMQKNKHSTIEGAIITGKQMNAKYIALTHISNRNDGFYIPINEPNAIIVFDFFTLPFDNGDEFIQKIKFAQETVLPPQEEQ